MSEAIFLALLGIITTSGGFVGRWLFQRITALETQVAELVKQNTVQATALAVLQQKELDWNQERTEMQSEIDDLKSRLPQPRRRTVAPQTGVPKPLEQPAS